VSQRRPVVTLHGKLPKTFKMLAQEHFDLDLDGLRKSYKYTRGRYEKLFGWEPTTQGQLKKRIDLCGAHNTVK
jgi:hypothetical protein